MFDSCLSRFALLVWFRFRWIVLLFVYGVSRLRWLLSPLGSVMALVCDTEFRGFLGMSHSGVRCSVLDSVKNLYI